VLVDWLGDGRDTYWGEGWNEGRIGFVEQDRDSVRGVRYAKEGEERRRTLVWPF
jgi:hypothetical protein